MATTVIAGFEEFLRETVNLDPDQTTTARASRDWLLDQVHGFPDDFEDFPRLYTDVDISFGSFARRTKIRPLDDIDQIAGIASDRATYIDYGRQVQLTLPSGSESNLRHYLHDGTQLVNSRKIINAFVAAAREVPQYANADISRNGEAAIINTSGTRTSHHRLTNGERFLAQTFRPLVNNGVRDMLPRAENVHRAFRGTAEYSKLLYSLATVFDFVAGGIALWGIFREQRGWIPFVVLLLAFVSLVA